MISTKLNKIEKHLNKYSGLEVNLTVEEYRIAVSTLSERELYLLNNCDGFLYDRNGLGEEVLTAIANEDNTLSEEEIIIKYNILKRKKPYIPAEWEMIEYKKLIKKLNNMHYKTV